MERAARPDSKITWDTPIYIQDSKMLLARIRHFFSRFSTCSKATPNNLKELSVAELEHLMAVATEKPWSADGRPDWVADHRGEILRVLMTHHSPEGPGVSRCIVFVFVDDRSGWAFTLDVYSKALAALKGTPSDETESLRARVASFRMLPLDPRQQALWDALEAEDKRNSG